MHDDSTQTIGKPEVALQGYSAKEAQLIRELVQARMEQQGELEYEKFDGYEIPPRTQFSMLNKPAVSIKYGKMTFNKACMHSSVHT